MSSRLIATKIIQRVIEDKINLSILFNDSDLITEKTPEISLIREMSYGTLRWYFNLNAILAQMIDKPIREKDQVLKYLLLVGLYQLEHTNIAQHAIVHETVETCVKLNRPWAKGFVNAILRGYIKNSGNIKVTANQETAHPEWLLERIKTDWPDHWQTIINANNQRPPMYLRVNPLKTSRDKYLKKLIQANIPGRKTAYTNVGIELDKPIDVNELPDFNEGYVSVQELAAQLAVELLDLEPGQLVLDACAAPGGKTAHILEYCPQVKELIAIEKDQRRAKKLINTLKRLGLEADIKVCDALHTKQWWDNRKFDRILLDTPCSATGVIRRHPDIKVLREDNEVEVASDLQYKLLATLWQTLKPKGILLYVTCSVLKQENSDVIKKFTAQNTDCTIIKTDVIWGKETDHGRQILTGENNMDGFFIVVSEKLIDPLKNIPVLL